MKNYYGLGYGVYWLLTDNPDSECHGMSGQMKCQMDAMTVLRSLMLSGELKSTGDEISQECKPFSGWKVKVEYEATDSDGKPYCSEYWFIMDKEAQCVIRSFEIPLLWSWKSDCKY